jgi:hypothetical protein
MMVRPTCPPVFYTFGTNNVCECDEQPTNINGIGRLLSRALNKNQILILSEVSSSSQTITSLLKRLSKNHGISLSTLKLNAGILRELELLEFGNCHDAKLTGLGEYVMSYFGGDSHG